MELAHKAVEGFDGYRRHGAIPGDARASDRAMPRTADQACSQMSKIARIKAKKNFCANDAVPAYENYHKRVLDES